MSRVTISVWVLGGLLLTGCAGSMRAPSEPSPETKSASSSTESSGSGLFATASTSTSTSTPTSSTNSSAPPLLPDTEAGEPADENGPAIHSVESLHTITLPKPPSFPSKRKAKRHHSG